jgi:hypothetical protein
MGQGADLQRYAPDVAARFAEDADNKLKERGRGEKLKI